MSVPLSPRRRRLRWTLVGLGLAFALGSGIGVFLYHRAKPAAYRPDERSDDITNELARNLPAHAPRPRFTDVTRQAGLADFRSFAGNRTSQLPEDMGPGVAWGDFDLDGDDDLFVVSAGGALNSGPLAPCALFENLGDGTFRRAPDFPELLVHGMSAAWGDYDGDGFLDLIVTGYDTLRLFHNESGSGRFTADPRLPDRKGFWAGATWGDFNKDRRLDLYVCNYVEYVENSADHDKVSDQIGTAVPFTLNPASYPGGRNALFRQNPDGTFTDVARELDVQNPEGRSLGALWHDFDQDGWLDLYVANDVSDNVFYRNTGGCFEDISHAAWIADYRSAMGLAAGDFDRDGDDDLFVTHWLAQENGLYENSWANIHLRDTVSRASLAGNHLRTSLLPPVRFVDIADQKGLGHTALPFVGWGTEFVDLDQDGWLDLLVVNGNTLESDGQPPRRLQPQETFVLWNEQGRHFHNLAPLHPGLSQKHVSRGLACADFDLDGDQDFIIVDLDAGVRLFRNDLATGNWLKIRLRSQNASGDATGFGDGSTIIAWLGDLPLRRCVTGASYLSQSTRTLHWGLGAASRVDRLEVRWHAGVTNVFEDIEANASYEIVEGASAPLRLAAVSAAPSPDPLSSSSPDTERERLLLFWNTQRAAMNALIVDKDNAKAIRLLREAITLNPKHEDSRYYLGLCLAHQGDTEAALGELRQLQQLNPQSHRAWQQWGVLRAHFPRSETDLALAEQALQHAHNVNPEETGALLVLGEVALLRGQFALAEERLAAATQANPRSIGGFFLRGYVAWKRGDAVAAQLFLEQARAALGPDWQPEGTTSEGDVKQKQHVHHTPLAFSWETWNGRCLPDQAFRALEGRLQDRGF
jgi:enediyne biosynthesis protein E4